jgi:hypothetical protein
MKGEKSMHDKARLFIIASMFATFLTLSFAPDGLAAGSSTQSRGGLTCKNQWGKTKGSTSCAGKSSVKWRLRVRCQFQPDYTGPWSYGPGSDAFECTARVQSASVQWGS